MHCPALVASSRCCARPGETEAIEETSKGLLKAAVPQSHMSARAYRRTRSVKQASPTPLHRESRYCFSGCEIV
jgi:hypothetical protein